MKLIKKRRASFFSSRQIVYTNCTLCISEADKENSSKPGRQNLIGLRTKNGGSEELSTERWRLNGPLCISETDKDVTCKFFFR